MATRHERVVLTLEDHFTTEIAKASAQVAVLDRELQKLARHASRNATANDRQSDSYARMTRELTQQRSAVMQTVAAWQQNNRQMPQAINQAQTLGRQFDRASGRVGLLAEAALALGPALVPVGAVAIPAVTGLANQLGIAVLAAGAAVVAFQGVGDAVSAMNEYSLDPSLDNLAKVREEFARISPQARGFAVQISQARSQLAGLRDAAAAGFLTPLGATLADIDPLLERVSSLLFVTGRALGEEIEAGADSLGGERWQEFFAFLEREAAPTMSQLSQVVGNTAHAMANMWMAFQPLNRDFGDWLVRVTRDWDRWSAKLDSSNSFQEFVEYVREEGPQVADTFSALGGAMVDIVEAAAPLGGPVLKILEALAEVVSTIADSEVGTTLIGMMLALSAVNRTGMLLTSTLGRVTGATGFGAIPAAARQANGGIRSMTSNLGVLTTGWMTAGATSQRQQQRMSTAAASLRGSFRGMAGPTAAMAGLGVAATGAADGIGLTNTISLALMGTMGGLPGVLIGGAIGAMIDLNSASRGAAEEQENLAQQTEQLRATLNAQNGAVTEASREWFTLQLSAEDTRRAMDDLGLSSKDATDLITGSQGDYQEWAQSLDRGDESAMNLAGTLLELRNRLAGARRTQSELNKEIGDTTAADNAAEALVRLGEAYDAWNDKLNGYNAVTRYESALDDLATSLDENGATFDANTRAGQANRDALAAASQEAQNYIATLPGVDQPAALEAARERIVRIADAYGFSRQEAATFADEVLVTSQAAAAQQQRVESGAIRIREVMQSLPREVVTHITTNGFPTTEAEVDALIAKYPDLEGKRSTLLELQSTAAELGLSTYIDALRQIPVRRVTNLVTRYTTEGTRPAQLARGGERLAWAAGGIYRPQVRAFDAGGFEYLPATRGLAHAVSGRDVANGHLPEITRPGGPMRVWSEPETKGEAYIPLADDWRRPRAIEIHRQTGELLGVPQHYADGGIRYQGSAAAPPSAGAGATMLMAASVSALQSELAALRRTVERMPRELRPAVRSGAQEGTAAGVRGNARRFGTRRKVGGL